MNEPQFTRGPWTDENDNQSKWGIYDSRGRCIAQAQQIKPVPEDVYQAERTANTKAIAATPDLYDELAHLVRLLEPLEQSGALNVPGLATLNGARAALAKARGEAI